MKLYAYCLCADLDTFDNSVSGVSQAAVRVLKVGDISVVVSDCEAVPVTQENMLAHAAVVRSVFTRTTTVPFRFGTHATEQQLQSFITTNKQAILNKLAHLRGCIEMDLKTTWQSSNSAPPKPDPAAGPGTAFLREKRRELLGDEQAAAQRSELSGILRTELGSLIKDEKIGLQPSEKPLPARVFHLVESSKIQEYRDKVQEFSQRRPELKLEVSGPWPPYSFANIELEFPLQFGVS
jgi:Gas vesicle synthesis protein GvpL/GvpF